VSQKKKSMPLIEHVLTIVTLYTQFTFLPTCHRAMACPAIGLDSNANLFTDVTADNLQKQSCVGAAMSESVPYSKVLTLVQSGIFPCFRASRYRKIFDRRGFLII
jgi:hypothetical protein